jgi:type I restriction enzyme R subunit
MRITGDDAEGVARIGNFIDPEAKYPVIVTTSCLLSTGVDAQTCCLIVLDREVGSMTEFKQIVGRGTRVHPKFDGEPVQIYEPGAGDPVAPSRRPAAAAGRGRPHPAGTGRRRGGRRRSRAAQHRHPGG